MDPQSRHGSAAERDQAEQSGKEGRLTADPSAVRVLSAGGVYADDTRCRSRLCQLELFKLWTARQASAPEVTLLANKQASLDYQLAKRILRDDKSAPFGEWLVSTHRLQAYNDRGERIDATAANILIDHAGEQEL